METIKVVTTHKWGYISTREWCHKPHCIFRGGFPPKHDLKYRADVVVTRNAYEAVASGYAYHRKGAECWVDQDFRPNPYPHGGNDHMRRLEWWAPLNVTREQARAFSHITNFCEVLVSLPESIGLHVYAEYAYHKWYSAAMHYLTTRPNSTIQCLQSRRRLNMQTHSSHEDANSRERHIEEVIRFDNSLFGGRYKRLQAYVQC